MAGRDEQTLNDQTLKLPDRRVRSNGKVRRLVPRRSEEALRLLEAGSPRHRPGDGPYQVFEPLPPALYASLKEDIAANGIENPVEEDEHGNVIDGHSRKQIWGELLAEGRVQGDYPRVVLDLTEEGKFDRAFRRNFNRRQLGPLAMGRALIRACNRHGIVLAAGARNDRTGLTIDQLLARYGVSRATGHRNMKRALALDAFPALAADVDAGVISAETAYRLVKSPSQRAIIEGIDRSLAGRPPYPKTIEIGLTFDPEADGNLPGAIARALINQDEANVELVVRALIAARPELGERLAEWSREPESSRDGGWDDLWGEVADGPVSE